MSLEFRVIEGLPDYAGIIELIKAEWPPEFGEKSEAEIISEMIESHDTERDRVTFLYEDNHPVGFYRYTSWPRSARLTDTAHTYDISVLPGRQGQGLGKKLMNHMIENCRSCGFKKLLSRSFKTNAASIKLHQRTGFRNSFESDDSIVWEINISPE